ncbi:MAG: HAD-IC family P-type ATPase [Nanoarchaeota archaeon]|jgi:Ca2+-transporting ATPase|nr:HAD-IC family P-type ATPase [Nanoarchaeota archaeon]
MEEVTYYNKSIEDSLKVQKSSLNGLSQEEAQSRLQQYGKNEITKKRKFHLLKVALSQFKSFFIYILIIATVISFSIGHSIDGFVIGSIVILNAVIGFIQQFKAEKAIQDLKKMIIPVATVLRNNVRMEIPSSDLVPGDIIILEAGDKVSADCRIIEEENLGVNESSLTGESLPVSKTIDVISNRVSLAEEKNMLFTGTQITRGTVKALVINTGIKTVFGTIAEDLQDIETVKTPIEKRLDKFSKQIGLIVLGMVVIIMLLGISNKFDLVEMFLISVALAVSAIPEGLPAVLTLGFAISSMIMSKKNVVIRKLPAVEALGSVTVICTDKTGTLTEEKMTIQEIFANNQFYEKTENKLLLDNQEISLDVHKSAKHLLETSCLCNNARFEKSDNGYTYFGDPTETALVEAAMNLGINKKELIEQMPSLEKLEFDSERKMMSVLRKVENKRILYVKGAPNKILESSTYEIINGNLKKLTNKRKIELLEQSRLMEKKALRVLGFAIKELSLKETISEEGLIFQGFAGMIDPPRKEVAAAIQECKAAGINVKIITGDSPVTAKAIGEQIGITGRVITELELSSMSNLELIRQIDEIAIFARMTPEQKLRITKILQTKGETVAITGDGVNDALALKSADVGIAMGKRGTDVSRDVADIVLVDDNFASIVEGVREGRRTYDNIKKFTKYLLAVNFSEVGLVLFALLANLPLPILPLQILWMNIASNSFPSLALVFEKGEDVMITKPRRETSILSGTMKYIVLSGVLAFLVELVIFKILLKDNPIELTRTMVLTLGILYELLFIYTVRSEKSLFKAGAFSNRWLNYTILFSLALHIGLLYSPLGNLFSLVPLSLNNWLFILPFAFSGLIIFEVAKFFKKK